MESHEGSFPCIPHPLEIPAGFPHSHGYDDGLYVSEDRKGRRKPARTASNATRRACYRKGLVDRVPGLKRKMFGDSEALFDGQHDAQGVRKHGDLDRNRTETLAVCLRLRRRATEGTAGEAADLNAVEEWVQPGKAQPAEEKP